METNQGCVASRTRKKRSVVRDYSDIKRFLLAVHCGDLEEGKRLLNIDTETFKTHKDKSHIAYTLMILGGKLLYKNNLEEGSLAYWKAYQIDPENTTVLKMRQYCDHPKSAKEIQDTILTVDLLREEALAREKGN